MLTFCLFVNIITTFCYTIEPVQFVETNKMIVIQRSTEMITRNEGLALVAYKDTKGYSIGYGTRSFNGEVITRDEAWSRMQGVVSGSVRRVMSDFPYASENEMVALTSLFYNCHGGYKRVKKEGYNAWLDPKFCTLKGYSGLIDRRNEERILLKIK